jgi:CheY-like chemotaxis protein
MMGNNRTKEMTMANEIKEGGLYWLGANVVMVWKPRSGRIELHRLDGRQSWLVDEQGALHEAKQSHGTWVAQNAPPTWSIPDLVPLTSEEAEEHKKSLDIFITPDGSAIMVAALFPGLVKGAEARRPRLLFLDDYIDRFRPHLAEMMKNIGADFVAFNNDDEAMAILQDDSQRFDAIVQDLQRPPGKCLEGAETYGGELTGLAFYALCVRKVRPELPCVFLTAEAKNPYVCKAAQELGNCRLVGKPLDLMELAEALRELT